MKEWGHSGPVGRESPPRVLQDLLCAASLRLRMVSRGKRRPMTEMVLGKPKLGEPSTNIVVFFAGRTPLTPEVKPLLDWLTEREIDFECIDALGDPVLAPLLEAESSKQLLPVLYAGGQLLRGPSLWPMIRNPGQLETWLSAPLRQKIPAIEASRRAIEELRRARTGDKHRVRLSISPDWEHELNVQEARSYDWVITFDEVEFGIDPMSLARADGVDIDWLTNDDVQGFVFKNPNSMLGLQRLSSEDFDTLLRGARPPILIDTRTEAEFLGGRIPRARLLDITLVEALSSLDRSAPLAFYCNNGVRSLSVARRYGDLGFIRVAALEGGIEAWNRHFGGSGP